MPGFLPIAWELKYKTNIALNFGNFLKSAICGPSESPSIVQICSTGDVVDIVIISRSCVVLVRTRDITTYAFILVFFFRSENSNLNCVCFSKDIICIESCFSILPFRNSTQFLKRNFSNINDIISFFWIF